MAGVAQAALQPGEDPEAGLARGLLEPNRRPRRGTGSSTPLTLLPADPFSEL